MKPYLQNIPVDCWAYQGRLGVAERNVCLFHPVAEPCKPLLEALDELESAGLPARRAMSFHRCDRPGRIATLKVRLLSATEELRVMHLDYADATVVLELTPPGLKILRQAIVEWGDGREDFGVSPRLSGLSRKQLGAKDRSTAELWFWGPGYDAP